MAMPAAEATNLCQRVYQQFAFLIGTLQSPVLIVSPAKNVLNFLQFDAEETSQVTAK